MGYLLFMDALGIQNYYNKGVEFANPVMNRIILTAKNTFNKSLPGIGNSMKGVSPNELCIMNDTIFVYSNQLTNLIYFSVKFLKSMFIPNTNAEPIAFRGAIAKTEKSPRIISEKDNNIRISKLVIDNISSAMVAEKQKILGARILIPKEIVNINDFKEWDIRCAARIMDTKYIVNEANILRKGFGDYYDLAWMIGSNEKQEKKMYENAVRFWGNAVFNERTSLHASVNMALLHASQEKKKRIINCFNKIYNKQKKSGFINENDCKPQDFKKWCEYANKLKKNQTDGVLLSHP